MREEGLSGFIQRLKNILNNPFLKSAGSAFLYRSKPFVVPFYIDPGKSQISAQMNKDSSIAVHLHLYHVDMADEIISYLINIPSPFDVFISIPKTADTNQVLSLFAAKLNLAKSIVVETVPNRGRDIAPFIVQFGARLLKYDIIAHVHTKRSPHNTSLKNWLHDNLKILFGPAGSASGYVGEIIKLLQTTAKLVYPEGRTEHIKDYSGWSANQEIANQILVSYTDISIQDYPVVEFVEGFMFWARSEALKEFLELPFQFTDFPIEPIPTDGTLAHALERLVLIFAEKHKGQLLRIHRADSIKDFRYFEEQKDFSEKIVHDDVKVLSYYLPQFHPIPENDLWHGKGFTEWTKVSAANPLFEGHYQQHIPHPDIGYYHLNSPKILFKQAQMMKSAGVFGQVFYHYWFSGKLILQEPAQMLLNNPDVAMPFCFCWANENWTRRWDGNESEILLNQKYSDQDAHEFICYLIPFFKDKRYIKIDDRPVLYVYRPSHISNAKLYLEIWEMECLKVGLKRPYIVAVLTRGANHPSDFGMDAGVERVLHDWTGGNVPELKHSLSVYGKINGSVLSYDAVADFYMTQKEKKDFTYFRSLVPIWDNTARYGAEAYLLHGGTPEKFQEWMKKSIDYSKETLPRDRRFLLINAWNEWAEGAHLEPDTRYGYSYLNSVGRALSNLTYADDLNSESTIDPKTKVNLLFSNFVLDQFKIDSELASRFYFCVKQSSLLKICIVSTDVDDMLIGISALHKFSAEEAELQIEFHKISLFDESCLEKLVKTALATRDTVLANSYDSEPLLPTLTSNGSTYSHTAYSAAILVKSIHNPTKNFRVRTDARCFVSYASLKSTSKKFRVTTIIRFHKSAHLTELKNALYCLTSMQNCYVTPLIAAQDLNAIQLRELQDLVESIYWPADTKPRIHIFKSPDGNGDLRAQMLTESLKKVSTRYAAFLDYDDLLMSRAYHWLIGRLEKTGKAVSFGRVFLTSYNAASNILIERKRYYEYGFSFEDFVQNNHAPLHSFILDVKKLNLENITFYPDQQYLEDYLLTLQLFSKENCDWASLIENFYIGDYIHSVDRAHTLAFNNDQERRALVSTDQFKICEQRIRKMQKSVLKVGGPSKTE